MKPIICTIVAGCFLVSAAALHAYMTPVIGGVGERTYIVKNGRIYVPLGVYGLAELNQSDGKCHLVVSGNVVRSADTGSGSAGAPQ